eukprot:scaffold262494_cov26-Tisochrysis_lutea.AAC.4
MARMEAPTSSGCNCARAARARAGSRRPPAESGTPRPPLPPLSRPVGRKTSALSWRLSMPSRSSRTPRSGIGLARTSTSRRARSRRARHAQPHAALQTPTSVPSRRAGLVPESPPACQGEGPAADRSQHVGPDHGCTLRILGQPAGGRARTHGTQCHLQQDPALRRQRAESRRVEA